jgi:hypothetical protein
MLALRHRPRRVFQFFDGSQGTKRKARIMAIDAAGATELANSLFELSESFRDAAMTSDYKLKAKVAHYLLRLDPLLWKAYDANLLPPEIQKAITDAISTQQQMDEVIGKDKSLKAAYVTWFTGNNQLLQYVRRMIRLYFHPGQEIEYESRPINNLWATVVGYASVKDISETDIDGTACWVRCLMPGAVANKWQSAFPPIMLGTPSDDDVITSLMDYVKLIKPTLPRFFTEFSMYYSAACIKLAIWIKEQSIGGDTRQNVGVDRPKNKGGRPRKDDLSDDEKEVLRIRKEYPNKAFCDIDDEKGWPSGTASKSFQSGDRHLRRLKARSPDNTGQK